MKSVNYLVALVFVVGLSIPAAYGSDTAFKGEALGTVNVDTYEAVTTYIYGDTAEAIFTATVALSRVETISNVLRRVVGQDLVCFEKLPEPGSTEAIVYTCKFIVEQGGKIVRPPL